MSCRVQLLPRAIEDAFHAQAWYEEQQEGLGAEFEESLEAALTTIRRFPDLYPRVAGDMRRCLLGKFPYGVFYEIVDDDLAIVAAVFHTSRGPEALADRL